jgi:mono/diheme cytochrome c family protein
MKLPRLLLVAALASAAYIARAADAAALFGDQCAKCHGEDGKGNTKMGKKLGIADLSDAKVQAKFTDADAAKAIKEGVKDKDGKLAMKPIEGLSDADIPALVAYVRTLKK